MNKFIVQQGVNVGPPFSGIGPYGNGGGTSPTMFTRALTVIIGVLTLIAGIWFIFLLITGGIEWIGSGGDKGKLASARSKMFSGAVGLAIVVAALFIADILGGLLGFSDILDPSGVIINLRP